MSEARVDIIYESPASGDAIPSPSYTFTSSWFSSAGLESVLVAAQLTDSTMDVGIEEIVDPSASYPLRLTQFSVTSNPSIGRLGGGAGQAYEEVTLVGRYYRLVVSINTPGSNLGFWATVRGKFL